MKFKNKNILIISPNKWGTMHVSKHHYAIELSELNNTVFFLNPPDLSKKYFEINQVANQLFIIDYKPIFRGQRFIPNFLYQTLILLQITFLQKKMKVKFDFIWSFSSSIYTKLKWFKADYYIYFPVDNIETNEELTIAKSADVVISISRNIIDKVIKYNKNYLLLNHGLSNLYADKIDINNNSFIKNDMLKVAFIGNLLIKSLDRQVFKEIILQNPEIIFVCYGAYYIEDSNLSGYEHNSVKSFINFLQNTKNVILKGSQHPRIIQKELSQYDVFLLLINPIEDYNKGSNSHKILEYLSTGKLIVSNYVSSYENRNLLAMVDDINSNDQIPRLFKKVINNLDYYNSPELQFKRKQFALNNTYKKQIERIESFISNNA